MMWKRELIEEWIDGKWLTGELERFQKGAWKDPLVGSLPTVDLPLGYLRTALLSHSKQVTTYQETNLNDYKKPVSSFSHNILRTSSAETQVNKEK